MDIITIYKLTDAEYNVAAVIFKEDASVNGNTMIAEKLRRIFNQMEELGFDPVKNMDEVEKRLRSNYNNGYYYID